MSASTIRKYALEEFGFDDAIPKAGFGRFAQTSVGLSYGLEFVVFDVLPEIVVLDPRLKGIPKKLGAPIAYS